jgi:hypothetical protein
LCFEEAVEAFHLEELAVGLLLALATLLTANRATALTDLGDATDIKRSDRWREIALDCSLGTITLLVWLAGLPLAIRAARNLQPLAHGGSLRSVFVLTWVLLNGSSHLARVLTH